MIPKPRDYDPGTELRALLGFSKRPRTKPSKPVAYVMHKPQAIVNLGLPQSTVYHTQLGTLTTEGVLYCIGNSGKYTGLKEVEK